MTTSHGAHIGALSAPDIVITSASGLVSCVPYLVGFTPVDSVVLVFMTCPPRRVAVTLRVDLWPDTTDQSLEHCLDQLGEALDRARTFGVDLDQVHVLVYSSLAAELPAADMVDGVVQLCRERAVEASQMLAVHGDRMWAYDCPDLGCCPGTGHPVAESDAVRVEFELVASGFGYALDRATLERAVQPDPHHRIADEVIVAANQECLAAGEYPQPGQRWRRGCEDSLLAAMRAPYDRDVALRKGAIWAVGLADSRVREPVLYRLLAVGPKEHRKERLASARAWLTGLVTLLPTEVVAPVAATLAALAWQQGDGAFARIAAERALQCDPANRLALLIQVSCGSGMPPAQWADILCSFTLTELRTATGPHTRMAV